MTYGTSARRRRRHAALAVTAVVLFAPVVATAHPASCRVTNDSGGAISAGSGTLIDATDDGAAGLVLTCAHLFSEGTGRVLVAFPDGRRHGALVVAVDRAADLAAVEIASPQVAPAEIATDVAHGGPMTTSLFQACGFGGEGRLACTRGRFVGVTGGAGRESWKFAGAVRSGDSGGGVFDDRGRLVAVVWGATDGVTYASSGGPLRRFLQRVLRGRASRSVGRPAGPVGAGACPDGQCPAAGPSAGSPPVAMPPVVQQPLGQNNLGASPSPGDAESARDCRDAVAALGARVGLLEKQSPEFARREQLEQLATADAVDQVAAAGRNERESLASRIAAVATAAKAGRAAQVVATGVLGATGPWGWAVVAAGTVGGWWIGRRIERRRRRRNAVAAVGATGAGELEATATPADLFPGAGADVAVADAGAHLTTTVEQPIERDDGEARELLRLSQLEGRDPLQDAVAGRLALDRLDAIADGDDDPPRRTWADRLRRELRERFNEIAPAKMTLGEGSGLDASE